MKIQIFEFWSIWKEETDAGGNLVVTGLLGPKDPEPTTAVFAPGQTSPKGSWVGDVVSSGNRASNA